MACFPAFWLISINENLDTTKRENFLTIFAITYQMQPRLSVYQKSKENTIHASDVWRNL